MTRARRLRVLMLALWGVCLVAATGAHLASPRRALPLSEAPAAVGTATRAPDAAVLPARAAHEVRAASQGIPLRLLVPTAVLAALTGLSAALRWRTSPAAGAHQTVRPRRNATAMRAPPLRFA